MIKANELRIGNWYINTEEAGSYYKFEEEDAHFIQDFKSVAEPIPLTPEILEKCGFKIINHIHGYSFYTMDRHNKKHLPPIDWYENRTLYYSYPVNHCKFVHQLQNLYFALTGIELEINL